MNRQTRAISAIAALIGGVLLPVSEEAASAEAKRDIFQQTPQVLNSYFGEPIAIDECVPDDLERPTETPDRQWCYLTLPGLHGSRAYVQYRENETLPVLYTYKPSSLANARPDIADSLLTVEFRSDGARRINLYVDGSGRGNFTYTPADARQLFNSLFGYRPPIWYPYKEEFGLGPERYREACLGDRIATGYTDYRPQVPEVNWFVNADCAADRYAFKDVENHWARAFIENLVMRNIIKGFPDGTYRPDASITRAEFASLLSGALEAETKRSPIEFVDVSPDFWGYQAIQTTYRNGFLTGYPGRIFRPHQPIPRVQALVALSGRFIREPYNPETLSTYRDRTEIPDYAKPAVARTTEAGWVVNYPARDRLEPNRPATRAEVAAFIYQAIAGEERFIDSPYIVK
ncbi:MAG: S-layer homology domain-containing protein [Cyanobacteriota bacterium]|nr:S-layer homology domain-containing protein [Cyanobacteriota bacterium]